MVGTGSPFIANRTGAYDAMFHSHNEAFADWASNPGSTIFMGNMAVVASNMVHTDASGLVVVQDDRLSAIQSWVTAEVYALHERMAGYQSGSQPAARGRL